MLRDSIAIPRAKATITHSRLVGVNADGSPRYEVVGKVESLNLLTDGGRRAIHAYIYGLGAQRVSLGGGLNYIALSNDGNSPAAGDTTLAGEFTTNGLQRTQGAVVLPTGSGNQTTISHVFTYTGVSPQGVQKIALFDAASGGNMAHEITFDQRTLFQNDTITVQFTLTVG